MSQSNPILGAGLTRTGYRESDNNGKQALLNHHKGPAAPEYAEAGVIWVDDAATPWLLKFYDGAHWITLGAINATANTFTPFMGTSGLRLVGHAADTGAANAYVIAPVPAVSAYAAGLLVIFKPGNANTGASTIAVSGLAAQNIKTPWGTDPGARALTPNAAAILLHDGANFIHLNPPPHVHGADIASAAAINLDAATGDYVTVTGAAAIDTITLAEGRRIELRLAGAASFVNGANLINITNANITGAAGDIVALRGEAAGVVRMVDYTRANGKSLADTGALILLNSRTFAASAQEDLTGLITASYGDYEVEFDITFSTDGTNLLIQTSADNGVNFDAGAADYGYAAMGNNIGALGADAFGDTTGDGTTTSMRVNPVGIGNQAAEGIIGKITLFNPLGIVRKKTMEGFGHLVDTGGSMKFWRFDGVRHSTAAFNALRFKAQGGTISGTIRIFGRKK